MVWIACANTAGGTVIGSGADCAENDRARMSSGIIARAPPEGHDCERSCGKGRARASPRSPSLMAEVGGTAAPPLDAAGPGAGRALRRARHFEAQAAAHRIGLGQAQGEPLAERVALAALVAGQALARLVVAEIFLPERRRRDEAVAAKLLHRGEEAEGLHAGDPALDQRSDLVGEKGGDVAVHRLAFGDHRAALQIGDELADHVHRSGLLAAEPRTARVRLQAPGPDQRAVDEEIGVTADRRGEMGVGAQCEPEMAVIVRAVISLGLRAQDLFHDLRAELGLAPLFWAPAFAVALDRAGLLDQAVERLGPHHLAERELDPERLQIILQRDEL